MQLAHQKMTRPRTTSPKKVSRRIMASIELLRPELQNSIHDTIYNVNMNDLSKNVAKIQPTGAPRRNV